MTAETGRFAPWLALFPIAGALLYFSLRSEPPGWLGGAAFATGVFATMLLRGRAIRRGAALCVTGLALGFLAGQIATWRAPAMEALPHHAVLLSGIVRQVDVLPHGRRLRLRLVRLAPDAEPLQRDVRIRLRDSDLIPVAANDEVQIRALLRSPAPPAFPGAWDLQRDAFFDHLAGSGWALGPVTVVQAAPVRLGGWWNAVRGGIATRFLAGLPTPEGAIAATLFTGAPTAIPAPDRAAFRDSGLAHLLAVAGLHIGIVMGLAFGATRLGLALSEKASLHWPCKQIAGAASLTVGAIYLLLTGAHVPIIRSFVMASLFVLALLAGRRVLSMRGLALAASVVVLVAPQEVMGVSFQMSFAAVLALITGHQAARSWIRRLRGHGWLWAHGAELALTSALAGVASMPFAAYHFGHIQLYFIFANLLAVPLTALLVMPAGLCAVLLMPLGWQAVALIPMNWGLAAILLIARTVSAWPDAVLPVPPMPGWGLLATALALCWICLWRSRLRWAAMVVMGLGVLSPWMVRSPDLLVSADTRLIALRTDHGMMLERSAGASDFTLQSWRDLWGGERVTPLPEAGHASDFLCDAAACRLGPDAGAQILLIRQDGTADCTGIGAVLLTDQVRHKACWDVPNIGRAATRRNGAAAIWLAPAGPRILFDRDVRGVRPWVILGHAQYQTDRR